MTETAMTPATSRRGIVAAAPGTRHMAVSEVVEATLLVKQVMDNVMTEGEHYGLIPGCGPKPTLFKAGAEKLAMTFRLAPTFDVLEREMPNGHREYRVACTLTHIPTGEVFGQGLGACSTMESKYRYRKGGAGCPKCGKDLRRSKDKPEWYCWAKMGGCGAIFPLDAVEAGGKVENPDIADTYNTVLKMAKKRAQVDATLTACGASDMLTQDLEDLTDKAESMPVHREPAPPPAPERQREPGDDDDIPLGGDDVASKARRTREAMAEMTRANPSLAREDIRAAAAAANLIGLKPKDLTDEQMAALGAHLPSPFTVH